MDRIGAKPAVDLGAVDCQHLETGTPGAGTEPGLRLGGHEQPVAAALRIGERRLDRVPAVQPKALRRRLCGSPWRPGGAAFRLYHALLPCRTDALRAAVDKRPAISILPPTFFPPGSGLAGF